MDCFAALAMTAVGAMTAFLRHCEEPHVPRHCEERSDVAVHAPFPRHCEERSDVAVHAIRVRLPLVHQVSADKFMEQTGRKCLIRHTFFKSAGLQAFQVSA